MKQFRTWTECQPGPSAGHNPSATTVVVDSAAVTTQSITRARHNGAAANVQSINDSLSARVLIEGATLHLNVIIFANSRYRGILEGFVSQVKIENSSHTSYM